MGLLLSVLVACVGVVELLAFCCNVSRNFVVPQRAVQRPLLVIDHSEDINPDEDEIFRRSPSPYPHLLPRNSICKELQDSVLEVDEDQNSGCSTPIEKIDVILESHHNTTQYWTNKVLVVPNRKSRSRSPCNPGTNLNRRKSKSENQLIEPEIDRKILDSLDGVNHRKINKNKRFQRKNMNFSKSDQNLSTSSNAKLTDEQQKAGDPFWVNG